MSVVTLNVIDGARGRQCYDRNGLRAWEYDRIAVVSELTPSNTLLKDAVDEVINNVGEIGEGLYPGTDSCYVQEFQPEALSTTAVKVRIVYKEFQVSVPEIEVGASVSQVESNKDINNNPISFNYVYPANYFPDPRGVAGNSGATPQSGSYARMVPEATVTFRRLESGSPLVKATQYVGSVNDAYWMGLPAGRWMCTSILGTRQYIGGYLWQVTYTFQARADTWQPEVFNLNPDTGKPVPKEGTGEISKFVTAYPSMDFANGLGL